MEWGHFGGSYGPKWLFVCIFGVCNSNLLWEKETESPWKTF